MLMGDYYWVLEVVKWVQALPLFFAWPWTGGLSCEIFFGAVEQGVDWKVG